MIDQILAITYIVFLCGFFIITTFIMRDVDITKIFKQGKIGSIRAAYFLIVFVVSVIAAFGLTYLVKMCYLLLS